MVGFWGLNIGLMGMIAITLVPDRRAAGDRELRQRLLVGPFAGSSTSSRSINTLLWLRMVPDTVFIFAGALPIVAAALWGC